MRATEAMDPPMIASRLGGFGQSAVRDINYRSLTYVQNGRRGNEEQIGHLLTFLVKLLAITQTTDTILCSFIERANTLGEHEPEHAGFQLMNRII